MVWMWTVSTGLGIRAQSPGRQCLNTYLTNGLLFQYMLGNVAGRWWGVGGGVPIRGTCALPLLPVQYEVHSSAPALLPDMMSSLFSGHTRETGKSWTKLLRLWTKINTPPLRVDISLSQGWIVWQHPKLILGKWDLCYDCCWQCGLFRMGLLEEFGDKAREILACCRHNWLSGCNGGTQLSDAHSTQSDCPQKTDAYSM